MHLLRRAPAAAWASYYAATLPFFFGLLFFGRLTDRVGRKQVYVGGALLVIASAFPIFWLINTEVFALMLLHSVFYVPTISITNSIAFANLRDPKPKQGEPGRESIFKAANFEPESLQRMRLALRYSRHNG